MVYGIYICINDIGITTLHFDLAHIWEHRIWLWCPRSWIISFPVDRIASSQRRTSSSWRTRTSSFGFMRPTTATRCGKNDAVQVVPFRIASSHLGSFYIIPNRDPRINPYIYIYKSKFAMVYYWIGILTVPFLWIPLNQSLEAATRKGQWPDTAPPALFRLRPAKASRVSTSWWSLP